MPPFGSASLSAGIDFELPVIAASIIGGTSLMGGEDTVLGAAMKIGRNVGKRPQVRVLSGVPISEQETTLAPCLGGDPHGKENEPRTPVFPHPYPRHFPSPEYQDIRLDAGRSSTPFDRDNPIRICTMTPRSTISS